MDEVETKKLSPEEAGALVAQWAEANPVTAEELGKRLDIDSGSLESLLNQSRGRLSMEKWTVQKKPAPSSAGSFGAIAAAGCVCLLIGGVLGHFLLPQASRGPAPGTVADAASSPVSATPRAGTGRSPSTPYFASPPLPPPPVNGSSVLGVPTSHMDIGNRLSVPVFSENAALRTGKVPVPDDVVFWLQTPAAVFTVEGRKTGNDVAARALSIESFLPILRRMTADALKIDPPELVSTSGDDTGSPQFVLRLGKVSRNLPIRWAAGQKSSLLSIFSEPVTKEAQELIQPFLESIRRSGKDLFPRAPTIPQPATPGNASGPITAGGARR